MKRYACQGCGKSVSEEASPGTKQKQTVTACNACSRVFCGESQGSTFETMEKTINSPNGDNCELVSSSENHEFSQAETHTCWICQEECDNEFRLLEHYVSHMESVELD